MGASFLEETQQVTEVEVPTFEGTFPGKRPAKALQSMLIIEKGEQGLSVPKIIINAFYSKDNIRTTQGS